MAQQPESVTEDEIEFDENDNKIIQLYEVINELIDDQKARIEDMELLYNDKGPIALQNVEDRNNSLLNQIFTELQLKEKNEDDEDDEDSSDSDDDDDSEDEQDQGWEIYNSVVSNLNLYMEQIALFTQKLKEQRDLIETYEDTANEEEIKELELVVEQQTLALEQQMQRNVDLEAALSSVLNEYSNRITVGNEEISSLHEQLSITNKQHTKQIQELKQMYEKKISELQKDSDSQYKEEVSQLIDTLSTSRNDFQQQIVALTQEMSEAQTAHHREMLTLTQYNQTLTEALAEKTLLIEELKSKQLNKPSQLRAKLKRSRTVLDIDDDEEFFYDKYRTNNAHKQPSYAQKSRSPQHRDNHNSNGTTNGLTIDSHKQSLPSYNGSSAKKTRTFTPSNYTSPPLSSQSAKQSPNGGSRSFNNSQSTQSNNNHKSSLQAKYAKLGNKGYKSRNKYSQRTKY